MGEVVCLPNQKTMCEITYANKAALGELADAIGTAAMEEMRKKGSKLGPENPCDKCPFNPSQPVAR